MSALRIVFICSGNICRSPMAAALAKHKFESRGVPVAILSCGTLGLVGRSAASGGVTAMAEVGIDLTRHYSQGVQPAILERADHIVVMAPRHERFILDRVPSVESRVVRMWTFAEAQLDQIDDPVNQDVAAFRTCRDLLDQCLEHWIDSLMEA